MEPEDALMVESKSRLRILVVEDNPAFMENALRAIAGKGHDALPATNLEEVLHLGRLNLDFILSDVHFPDERGGKPVENIVPLMHAALEANVPICFVTQADHHGLTESNEGYISIKPLTIGNLFETLAELTGPKADQAKKAFLSVKSTNPMNIKANAKTPEIWARAIDGLRNACAQAPGPVELVARAVTKDSGLVVGVEKGLPVLRASRR